MDEPIISQRRNFIWNMLGTFSSASISIILLLIVSRLTNAQISDTFSIAFTLSQQFVVIAYYGVRNFQSTDTKKSYGFNSYLLARILTVVAMFIVMFFYSKLFSITGEKFLIILFMTLYRSCEAFSDVYQGLFQQHQRSDLAGKVLFYRSVASLISFVYVIYSTGNLLLSSITLFIVNVILLFMFDYRYYFQNYRSKSVNMKSSWREAFDILRICTVIFLSTYLINSIFNDPKLVIDKFIENKQLISGTQRDFNILFMPTFVLNLLFILLRPIITELSIYWHRNEYAEYYKKVKMLSFYLFLSVVSILFFGFLFGVPLLSIVFAVDLSSYRVAFLILLIGGGFNLFAVLIDNLMTIQRKQNYLLVATFLTYLISQLIVSPLINNFAILGASISFAICMFVYFCISLIIFHQLSSKM